MLFSCRETTMEVDLPRGANVTSFRIAGFHEVMAQGTSPTSRQSFAEGGLRGFDECFPTIEACEVGEPLPDHGAVWATPHTLEEHTEEVDATRVVVSAGLFGGDVRLDRQLLLTERELRIRSTYRNHGVRERPYLWAGHLLLATEPAFVLRVPRDDVVTDFNSVGLPVGSVGALSSSWPRRQDGFPIGGFPRGHCLKAYLTGQTVAELDRGSDIVTVTGGTGVTNMGLWINRGSLMGRHHLGLEPTTASADSLASVVSSGRAPILKAGEAVTFGMSVRVDPVDGGSMNRSDVERW